MSSRGSPSGARGPAEDSTVWHNAQEWLEDDGLDMDYHPPDASGDDDSWEDDVDEDEGMGLGVSDGMDYFQCSWISIKSSER